MLKAENRKGQRIKKYASNTLIEYLHHCKKCGKDMYKTVYAEKVAKGYCRKCAQINRKENTCKTDEFGNKKCNKCKLDLPLNEFKIKDNKLDRFFSHCLKCRSLTRFGITSLEWNSLFKSQNGLCSICKTPENALDYRTNKPKRLSVDHCHLSGKVRGLLCSKCNHAIGLFKDDLQIIQEAVKYLKKYK